VNFFSEEFQPMSSQSINVTDRQTDGQTTCNRKTALLTVVHCAVKTTSTNSVSSPVHTSTQQSAESEVNRQSKFYLTGKTSL